MLILVGEELPGHLAAHSGCTSQWIPSVAAGGKWRPQSPQAQLLQVSITNAPWLSDEYGQCVHRMLFTQTVHGQVWTEHAASPHTT